jgi:catechol 2,3-dioxygenase-like lactoylglutathione lyase family enzyme
MKKLLITIAGCLALLSPAGAQLVPVNESGITMGHIHMNVRDVAAHRKFWTDLGATPVRIGQAEAVKGAGFLVIFRQQEPTGVMDGSVVNHIGLLVPNFDTLAARLNALGTKIDAPRAGSAPGIRQTTVYGPEQFRMELTEDAALPTALASHHGRPTTTNFGHLHYRVPSPADAQRWYATMLGATPGRRANWEAVDVPGMNITLQGVPQAETALPTKGRIVDHIGFEVRNLEAFAKRLQADGMKLETPYRKDPELGVASVFLTDPWGTSIELTEGLAGF